MTAPCRAFLGAAYAPHAAAVTAPMRVEATTNEHNAALRLLGVLPPLAGAVVTADALFTHAGGYDAILQQQGHDVRYAQDNRGRLQADSAEASRAAESGGFSPKGPADWRADVQPATSRCKGHGRIERRTITTRTWRNDYLTDGPQLKQVFRLVRQRTVGAKTTEEVVYGITSLGREEADAGRLQELCRAQWGMENGLHHTRDETFGEDRGRVRRGQAARVWAAQRDVAVYGRRRGGHPNVAAATRAVAAHPDRARDWLKAAPANAEYPWTPDGKPSPPRRGTL